jgi:arylsulfatase A-like enzyme
VSRLWVLALLCVLAPGCGGPTPPQGVLLITLDTTRADRLGCYGYERAETPNLDGLAAEGVLFRQVQAPVPVTLPCHASMFTGNYPPAHGVRYNGMFQLDQSSVTVAELLRDAGWSTAGMPAAYPLTTSTGIGQGFQVYRDMFEELEASEIPISGERPASEISQQGVDFLREKGQNRFFLWLHYWEPHYPYEPPFPFSARFRDRPYDGEIAYADQEIGRVLDFLRETGLWERTLLVVAGDHGEGLYEHREKMHANLVYQSTLRAPLIIKPAGAARPGVVEEPVSLADVAPTILDFAGVDGPEMEGISLRPAVYGDDLPERSLYFESLAGSLVFGWSQLDGLRRGAWKYVRSSSPELFNLDEDPGELNNLYAAESERASEMEDELVALENVWRQRADTATTTPTPMDQESLEMLASLGYIGGFVTEERQEGPDPRDLIHLEMEVFAARDEMANEDYVSVLRRMERVLAANPTNRHALRMAAKASRELGFLDRALDYTGRALEHYPEFVPARIMHGELLVKKGELEEAAETFEGGLEDHPDDPHLNYKLAVALYALGRTEEALGVADRMIAAETGHPTFLVLRAACRARAGEGGEALAALRQAIEEGYREREILEDEPLLEVLRGVPGFDEVLRTIPES